MTIISELTSHFYSLNQWKKFPLIAGFTDRSVDFSLVPFNREERLLLHRIGINPDTTVIPHQVHGREVSAITAYSPHDEVTCDGLVTHVRGISLCVRTADCVPLLCYAPRHAVIGIAHIGWRGAHKGIVNALLTLFSRSYKVSPADIHCALGPAIRSCCYTVHEDVASLFPHDVEKRDRTFALNIPRIVKGALEAQGVHGDNIIDTGLCTYCMHQNFYSYRREGDQAGRMLSLIMMRK